MINFPEWSDLGLGTLDEVTRESWDEQLRRCQRRQYYFDGLVFEERIEDSQQLGEAPLLFPVGLNLVKMMCTAQADSTFGEWDEVPVSWGVRQEETPTSADQDAVELINQIMVDNNAAQLFWEHDLDRQVFGGGALKISFDNNAAKYPGHIRWMRVPRGNFFPIYNPLDPDELLEVYLVNAMTPQQAKAMYGIETSNEIVRRIEHWTKTIRETFLDDKQIDAFSGANPWGVVPFVYTPRLRFDDWYGDSLVDELTSVQDEMNMRLADIGEAINYNANPVRWGVNMPRDFNADNYPLAPNAFWNLGRALPGAPVPEVGILEAKSAVSPGVFEHVNFIYDWGRTASFAPPIAFGEDNGGGQRSGVTLEIRMNPLIKSTRRSRSYLASSLKQALYITGLILKQKNYPDTKARAIDSLMKGRIRPRFYPLLPRDQAALVDEVVKLLSTTPPSISLETAQRVLGRGSGEVERIKEMIDDEELKAEEPDEFTADPAAKDKGSVPNRRTRPVS